MRCELVIPTRVLWCVPKTIAKAHHGAGSEISPLSVFSVACCSTVGYLENFDSGPTKKMLIATKQGMVTNIRLCYVLVQSYTQ